ncbi:MAG: cation:proton antiporter subunit C [Leptolyngbyaceae bacterium]|nr:cation:proton antiporter subunit C [Leptolyngbyaceae bacterium]
MTKLILEACMSATILCGFLGIILKRNLMMKILAMDVMSTGVIAYYILVAARGGKWTPILTSLGSGGIQAVNSGNGTVEVNPIAYADPVPQAVILTAIVIGFSIQALMLVGVMKLSRDYPTLDTRAIEDGQS